MATTGGVMWINFWCHIWCATIQKDQATHRGAGKMLNTAIMLFSMLVFVGFLGYLAYDSYRDFYDQRVTSHNVSYVKFCR